MNQIGATAALLTPFAIVACAAYPLLHNHYVHPMGRLASSLGAGDSCDEVASSFQQYADSTRSADVQLELHGTTPHIYFNTTGETPQRTLFLYDLSLFDDLQIHVLCSHDNRLAETVFVGD